MPQEDQTARPVAWYCDSLVAGPVALDRDIRASGNWELRVPTLEFALEVRGGRINSYPELGDGLTWDPALSVSRSGLKETGGRVASAHRSLHSTMDLNLGGAAADKRGR